MSLKQIKPAINNLWQDLKKQYNIIERPHIKDKITDEIANWTTIIDRHLRVNNPFYEDKKVLDQAKKDYENKNYSSESIEHDLNNYSTFKQKINSNIGDFWQQKLTTLKGYEYHAPQNQTLDNLIRGKLNKGQEVHTLFSELKKKRSDKIFEQHYGKLPNNKKLRKQIEKISNNLQQPQKSQSELQGLRGSLLNQWEQDLDKAIIEWEIKEIEASRRKLFKQLTSWLDLLSKLLSFLDNLSLEPGLLFDLSIGELTNQDIKELEKWLKIIEQDEGAKKLCDMLGKLRTASQSQKKAVIKTTKKIKVQIPDANSKEEITGIVLGNDLENIIPAELVLLSDGATADLFDLKFVEKRLLCFENQGLNEAEQDIASTKKIQITEDDEMGPIIICVDTSGSMAGSPETIAKAITLYMATRAKQQDRNCYLINFSTTIETLDLSDSLALSKLLDFLSMSFHGGTDVAPALQEALEQLKTNKYTQADVLTISDFVMSGLPEPTEQSIKAAKKKKNKFYSLCIGNHFYDNRLKLIFDQSWVYNPTNKDIIELTNFMEKVF